jgi:hypothetical protein
MQRRCCINNSIHTMSTSTDRVAALWAIYDALDALITPDEIENYGGCLHHLGDLIEDWSTGC